MIALIFPQLAFGVWALRRLDADPRPTADTSLEEARRRIEELQAEAEAERRYLETERFHDELLAELRRHNAALERQGQALIELAQLLRGRDQPPAGGER